MLYLVFVRPAGWMALLARSAASKDAQLVMLRQEAAGAAATEPATWFLIPDRAGQRARVTDWACPAFLCDRGI